MLAFFLESSIRLRGQKSHQVTNMRAEEAERGRKERKELNRLRKEDKPGKEEMGMDDPLVCQGATSHPSRQRREEEGCGAWDPKALTCIEDS